jgi:hypothetical protein
MTNITLGAQCIGLYECPPRKRRKTEVMEDSCGKTRMRLRGGRDGWKAMESTQILLRYFVNAASEKEGREVVHAPRMSNHEKYYVPQSENEP